jgi:hypothetical protein
MLCCIFLTKYKPAALKKELGAIKGDEQADKDRQARKPTTAAQKLEAKKGDE